MCKEFHNEILVVKSKSESRYPFGSLLRGWRIFAVTMCRSAILHGIEILLGDGLQVSWIHVVPPHDEFPSLIRPPGPHPYYSRVRTYLYISISPWALPRQLRWMKKRRSTIASREHLNDNRPNSYSVVPYKKAADASAA
jgi:hypothetical protein